MSNKAGGRRSTTTNSDLTNHSMVSEVPPERPSVRQWNKRWFVLVDRCLFYYKDEKEESVLGSVPLLSFRVAAVQPSDNISRKHTFKPRVGL
ncbi:PLEKHA6 [Cervus elaphus hippelaphus]|uniref:PLEKHA6 n=1 Tax=Cervus elaphus hippelaphus TaxID=46360 RepID=A0A212CR01_CEREH|nr:PLEKHA6 [Cervus elaphus hippelaphus]